MLDSMHERGINKDENIKMKFRKCPGAYCNILDHVKNSLQKAPEQIAIMLVQMIYLTISSV